MTSHALLRLVRSLSPLAFAAGALVLAAGAAVADSPAPGASGGPAASGAPGSSSGPAISIIQKTFQPADLTIQAGQTVTWTVTQAIADPHSVTSGSPTDAKPGTVFDSGIKLRNDGDSFSFTFTTAGTYPYFCAVHPDTMHGTITVQAASDSGAGTPSPDGSGKLITAIVLIAGIVVFFGWARIYRRMNPD